MHKDELIVYWSSSDDTIMAEVPELPRCTIYGNNQEAALQNIKEAMTLWIDTAREFGDPIPEP